MWHPMRRGICSHLKILLVMLLTRATHNFKQSKCYELSEETGCECYSERGLWHIVCPAVRIEIGTGEFDKEYVSIKCEQRGKIEINSLPKMNIGNRNTMSITNCELSNEPIALLLDQLGIENVHWLTISYNILGFNFTRMLAGLSELVLLMLWTNDLTVLPSDLFADLSNLTTLIIDEDLVKLPPHIFDPLKKLTELDLSYNSLDQLPDGIFRNQHKLKKLSLIKNRLHNLNKNAFVGAISLQELDLRENGIDRFELDIFSLLPTLRKINLSVNKFRELPLQLFANNKNLTGLKICNNLNALELEPSALFNNLSDLQELHITCNNNSWYKYYELTQTYRRELIYTNCGVRDIPGALLTNSINWTYVSLAHNDLRLLPDSIFFDQSNMNALDLSYNKLQSVQHGLFSNRSSLVLLDLAYNQLTELSSGSFLSLGSLEQLYLNNNKLRSLPDGLFNKTTILNELTLSYNQLTNISAIIFSPLVKLEYLYLDNNELYLLADGLFLKSTNLLQLKLSNNQLIKIPPEIFSTLVKLKGLYLDNNELELLPDGLFNKTTNIVLLNISHNQLFEISAEIFSSLVKLKELYLDNNKLHSLPDGLFRKTSNMVQLVMSYNQLFEISDKIFSTLDKLEKLYLDNNELRLLPDGLFRKTTNLVELKLSYNQLTNISDEIFSPLLYLEKLFLDNNYLKNINRVAFIHLKRIQYISMGNNRIEFINHLVAVSYRFEPTSPFYLLDKLQTLNLRNNSIQHIYWDWRTEYPNLKELDLSFNEITTLNYADLLFKPNGVLVNISHNQVRTINFENENLLATTSYKHIDLNFNPLDCDCKLLFFLLYLRGVSQSKINFGTDNLLCAKPEDIKLKLVPKLNPEELLCSIKHLHCPFGCYCWERTYDATLLVNCSNANFTKMPTLAAVQTIAFRSIELYVANNKLPNLSIKSLSGYAAVKKIFAAGNNISQVDVHDLPTELTYLDLSRNNLKRLDSDMINHFNRNQSLALAGNPWDCNCESRTLFLFAEGRSIIADYKKMFCSTPKNVIMHNYFIENDLCQEKPSVFRGEEHGHRLTFILIVSCLSVCLLIAIIIIACYKYETDVKIWIYSCPWLRRIVSESDVDNKKVYDAFVSYAHKDQEFIGTILVPELERNGPIHYKLCVHVRDFIGGEYITDQIIQAINESRRTIIVLSKHFIQSTWACFEFRLAHKAAVEEGRTRVIVIMYDDVGDIDLLEPILRAYLRTNTYLVWGDPWFWDKLRYAMSHSVNAPPNQTSQATTAV